MTKQSRENGYDGVVHFVDEAVLTGSSSTAVHRSGCVDRSPTTIGGTGACLLQLAGQR